MAKLADAQVSGSCGRPYGFESLHPHHKLATKKILPEKVLIFQGFFRFSQLNIFLQKRRYKIGIFLFYRELNLNDIEIIEKSSV